MCLRLANPPNRLDDDRLDGRLAKVGGVVDGDIVDPVDNIHAFGHFAKDTVAIAGGRAILIVERWVVGHVDEELAGGAVDGVGLADHGDRASEVSDVLPGFVADRRTSRFLDLVRAKTAGQDALPFVNLMDDRAIVEAGAHVGKKVLDGDRGLFGIQSNHDVSERRFDDDHRMLWIGGGFPWQRSLISTQRGGRVDWFIGWLLRGVGVVGAVAAGCCGEH